jgi:molecular chaperone GrpE
MEKRGYIMENQEKKKNLDIFPNVEKKKELQKMHELPKAKDRKTLERIEEEVLKERKKADDYLKKLQYLQADFENYKKRIEKRICEIENISNELFVKNLINTIDELEFAIKAGKESENKNVIVNGVNMILKKLYNFLEQEGLSRIEGVGNKFDPCKHEVIDRIINDKLIEGTIVEEIRKGYIFRGKVIRVGMVKIATKSNKSKKDGQ